MDGWAFEFVNGLAGRSSTADGLATALARYGPLTFVVTFIALWFWPGPRHRRDRWQRAAMSAAGSTLGALGVNQAASRLWPRPRPFVHHAAVLLLPASHDPSFPSDHAAFAFAAATVLFLVSRRAGAVALAFAALAALSRVYVGEHYPMDVVAGAVVGSLVALGFHALRGRLEPLYAALQRAARRVHLA